MKGSICRVRNTRLGLKLDHRHNQSELGWALVALPRPKRRPGPVRRGDPVDLARQALTEEPGSCLYVYLNDHAYRGTRGHKDGLRREQHLALVNRVAAELAAEGFHITICEVE